MNTPSNRSAQKSGFERDPDITMREKAAQRAREIYPMANEDDYPDNPNVNRLNNACAGAFVNGFSYALQVSPSSIETPISDGEFSGELVGVMKWDKEANDLIIVPLPEQENEPSKVEGLSETKSAEEIITEKIREINPKWDYGETHEDVFRALWYFFDPPVARKIILSAIDVYAAQFKSPSVVEQKNKELWNEVKRLEGHVLMLKDIISALKADAQLKNPDPSGPHAMGPGH